MSVLFCGIELARRIEHAEAALISAAVAAAMRRGTGGFAIPVAGGVAAYGEPDAPFNKVAGLGFAGVPSGAELGAVERANSERGAPTVVELSNLADPEILALLAGRGYRVLAFEDVLGRALDGVTQAIPDGMEIRPARAEEIDAWVDVMAEGFAHPDGAGVPSPEEFGRDVIERAQRDFATAGVTAYVAVREGRVVGGGSLRITAGVAQLTGAATAPAYRRRGIQTALLAVRLRDAAAAGADIAVVTTSPGSTSQQNVQRSGFHLLYTRAVLVRAPDQ
ncbi:GNAT family N-acetyltransferase [Mycolicibacterium neoaurum]|uniref:GNAT family N-acetyltransferase n=1 Tax=Mycolicibacterium neoaurum TaxID=1795 RepID=UPI0026737320|nr:GNAT family N-acetyltransferase [Mycolicibacterium neoaurum]MDO3400637.1 GNAT family N-acetyltransferase [Mycolicibacterium neoaurum]